jgi:hypothetical protein
MTNNTPSASPPEGSATRPHEKAAEFRVFYSNIFQYRLTITDLTLIFATLADTGEPPNTFVQTQQAAVIMSLGQAKSLAEYLTMIVSRYERDIGPINTGGKAAPSPDELDGIIALLRGMGTH